MRSILEKVDLAPRKVNSSTSIEISSHTPSPPTLVAIPSSLESHALFTPSSLLLDSSVASRGSATTDPIFSQNVSDLATTCDISMDTSVSMFLESSTSSRIDLVTKYFNERWDFIFPCNFNLWNQWRDKFASEDSGYEIRVEELIRLLYIRGDFNANRDESI